MDSDPDNGRDWDVDHGDGAREAEAMDFLFDQSASDVVPVSFETSLSPGKTKYWVPTCEIALKPKVGQKFSTIEEGIEFYKKYGALVGFDARKSTSRKHKDGSYVNRYMRCHRQGYKESSTSTGKRNRYSNRVGCNAHIYFKFAGSDGYVIENMEERHTHPLLQDESNHFLKARRKLDFGHQLFMINCAKAHLGPARTHRLMKENWGGSSSGPLLHDLKNFKRDIMAYISWADAQMVIDRFMQKQQSSSGFYFAYDLDSDKRLVRLFWCDPIARANYAAFGDVLSFDSTYRTNKYSMVFAPFTGLDNHKKSVTFGAGLLLKETEASYTWLLQHFKMAMCKDPVVIVTDQDPSLKESVPKVFPDTRHRFCMWHIMMKVPREVPSHVCSNTDFRKRFNEVVWSSEITIKEFEHRWHELMREFSLEENRWLKLMFKQRNLWIPAYFRDVLLGGLIRTTSISESANSFFGHYSGRHFSMVELMMHFDGAMDAQRHAQVKFDVESSSMVPVYETRLDIERHASSIYTLKVFEKVQNEIADGVFGCNVQSECVEGDFKKHVVSKEGLGLFNVQYDIQRGSSKCSCNMFHRVGLPCNHIFCTYKYMGIKEIPVAMVLPRWTKDARRLANDHLDDEVLKQCGEMEAKKLLLNKLWSTIYSTVGTVEDDAELIHDFLHMLTEKKTLYMKKVRAESKVASKDSFVEKYVGVKPPNQVTVHPPPPTNNKGSRIKGFLEKATEKSAKSIRKCGRCGKMAPHNRRTCKEDVDIDME